MEFTVRIKGHEDTPVKVEMGRTILDCCIEQGAPFAFSCRSGNCGTCKCFLVSGEVEMSPYSEFALSAKEADRGFILACRSVPWEDCVIELAGEDDQIVHPMREMNCRVSALDELTHDIRHLRLTIEAGGPFTYTAGQYAEIRFPGLPGRSYSMAGQPEDEELSFYVRILPGGKVSRHLVERVSAGDQVAVKGPYGSSYLREGRKGPIIAIAGGSGLAPIQSIVDRAMALDWSDPVYVYFGVRDQRDLYLTEHFEGLAGRHEQISFVPVLSEPSNRINGRSDGRNTGRTGWVTDAVRADFTDLSGFAAYLAGPPPMVEAATSVLPELGVAPRDIHADAFFTDAEQNRSLA